MVGRPQPFPNREQALADYLRYREERWPVEVAADHFRKHYPANFEGRTWDAIRMRLSSLHKDAIINEWLGDIPDGNTNYRDAVPELRIPFQPHIAVLSDPHASAHDERGIAMFVATVKALSIPTVIINGDLFDNAYLGHAGIRNARSASAAENIFAGASICNALTKAGVKRVYGIQGNHDDKPLRNTDGELLYTDWWRTQVEPQLYEPEKFTITHRYYAIMEAMEPRAEGTAPHHFPTRFTHQKEYGRVPLGVAMRLADKFMMNIVTGHQHHLGASRHKSGKLHIADAGTLQAHDVEYKVNRDTTHPEWCRGFLTLHHGVPRVWNLDNPDIWWDTELAR